MRTPQANEAIKQMLVLLGRIKPVRESYRAKAEQIHGAYHMALMLSDSWREFPLIELEEITMAAYRLGYGPHGED